jgi:deoxyribose-phosphate aldolase
MCERDIAKTIDHSLLRPELDDAFVADGCRLAAAYDVASVCVRPADVARARAILTGTDVVVGTTIGFPHGNSSVAVKVFETREAIRDGAVEIDLVVNLGKVVGGDWAFVEDEIRAVMATVIDRFGGVVSMMADDESTRSPGVNRICPP